jgi:hypothetical protein
MTVMLSRSFAAVLGMTRTTRVLGGTRDCRSEVFTPAQMLIRSFPSSAEDMPRALRMCATMYGLHPRRTMSALRTPLTLESVRTVTELERVRGTRAD